MAPARRGVILNISSVVGIRGYADQSAYTAAKHGIMGLTKSLAVEFGRRGVRANCVCPSSVATDFLASFEFTDAIDRSLFDRASSVIEGPMDPSVVAAAIAYLASDDAAMITGAALMLDGGATS